MQIRECDFNGNVMFFSSTIRLLQICVSSFSIHFISRTSDSHIIIVTFGFSFISSRFSIKANALNRDRSAGGASGKFPFFIVSNRQKRRKNEGKTCNFKLSRQIECRRRSCTRAQSMKCENTFGVAPYVFDSDDERRKKNLFHFGLVVFFGTHLSQTQTRTSCIHSFAVYTRFTRYHAAHLPFPIHPDEDKHTRNLFFFSSLDVPS